MTLTPYVSSEAVKGLLNIRTQGTDARVERAVAAAVQAVESACDRDFHVPDTGEDQERYFTPVSPRTLTIDDVLEIHELATDLSGTGTFSIVWEENRDFVLEPLNAPAKLRPFERVKVHPWARFMFSELPRSVRVTGVFGWPEVPPSVVTMTEILAVKLYKRAETPFGVAAFGTDVAMRVLQTDPDYMLLLGDFLRDPIVYP